MPVFASAGRGAATAFRKPRILLVLYLANLGFALLVAWPFFALAKADLGHSLLGRNLQGLDFIWLGDLVYRYRTLAPAVAPWLLGHLMAYAVLSVFLGGGTIGRLLDPEGRPTVRSFFSDCGRYFGRFFRLFILAVPFYLLALGVLPAGLTSLLEPLDKNAPTAWTPFGLAFGRTALVLLALSVVHMVFDYARIHAVSEDEPGALRAVRAAGRFLGRRFFRAWGLYLLVALGFLAATVLAGLAAGRFPGEGLFFAGAAAAGMQAYILFRLWTRMVFFAAQADFYRSAHP